MVVSQMKPAISDPGRDFSLINIVTPDGGFMCVLLSDCKLGSDRVTAIMCRVSSAPALPSGGRGRAAPLTPHREISTLRPGPRAALAREGSLWGQ